MSLLKDTISRMFTGLQYFPYLKKANAKETPVTPVGVTKFGKLVILDPEEYVGPEGPQGEQGEQGIQGEPGENGQDGADGVNATITGATAVALASGETPTVTLGGTPTARTFEFGIPSGAEGEQGESGADGAAAGFGTPTASITMGAVGSEPTVVVTASGPDTAKVFNFVFTIPASQ